MLTGEIVPEAVDASASANTKAQKRNSWRSALGFKGRSSAAAAASGSDNKKNGESKKKEKKHFINSLVKLRSKSVYTPLRIWQKLG